MKRFKRWQFWAPRFMALVVMLLALQHVANSWIKARLEQSIAAVTGGRSQLSAAHVAFARGRLRLGGLRIFSPRQPAQRVVSAEYGELNVPWNALFQRGPLILNGQLRGVRFADPASVFLSSLSPDHPAAAAGLGPSVVLLPEDDRIGPWLIHTLDRFDCDDTDHLPSLELTNRLAGQCQSNILALRRKVDDFHARARLLHATADAAANNPLRNVELIARLPDEAAAMGREMQSVAAEAERLPDAVDAVRREIVSARTRDELAARRCLASETPVADDFTAHLCRDHCTQLVGELLYWARALRQSFPASARDAAPRNQSWLLRSLALDGVITLSAQTVPVRGNWTDLTSEPWQLDRPMRLRLRSTGSQQLDIHLTVDRSGPVPRDELLMECRDVQLPMQRLGRLDGLRLTVGPAAASFNASIRIEGDSLTGNIQCVRRGAPLAVSLSRDARHSPVSSMLQQALGRQSSIATRVELTGSLSRPRASVWSNLGTGTATAFTSALDKAAAHRAGQLAQRARQRGDERLAEIDRLVFEGQSALFATAESSSQILGAIASQAGSPTRPSAERFGQLPAGSLFR